MSAAFVASEVAAQLCPHHSPLFADVFLLHHLIRNKALALPAAHLAGVSNNLKHMSSADSFEQNWLKQKILKEPLQVPN